MGAGGISGYWLPSTGQRSRDLSCSSRCWSWVSLGGNTWDDDDGHGNLRGPSRKGHQETSPRNKALWSHDDDDDDDDDGGECPFGLIWGIQNSSVFLGGICFFFLKAGFGCFFSVLYISSIWVCASKLGTPKKMWKWMIVERIQLFLGSPKFWYTSISLDVCQLVQVDQSIA